MPNIPAKHIEFIKQVAAGQPQAQAYRATVGNQGATIASVKSKASKLAKKYAKEIETEKNKAAAIVEAATIEAIAETAKNGIKSLAERMELLSQIMDGKIKIKKPFVIAGKIMEYPSEPDHNDRIKAIAELNKMDGSYAPTKQQTELTVSKPIIIDWTGEYNNTDTETT
jgi:hypothetical protein